MVLSKAFSSDRFWFRVILVIGIVAIPLFGVMMEKEMPDCKEFMSHRLAMSATWTTLLVLSWKSRFFKKHLITLVCWLLFILNVWVVWIVYLNQFALYYSTGLLIAFCAMSITYRRPKLYFIFYSITILAILIAGRICHEPKVSTTVLSFAILIIGIVFMLSAKIIINTEKQLHELNLTLEKKVAERTAEAENKSKLLTLKNQELEQFAYIASHDLKSPLRNISGFVQLIQRKLQKQDKDGIEEYIGFVVKSVNKMDNVINDVLLYSRYGSESTPFERVDMGKLVDEVFASMVQEINKKKATVCHNLTSNIHCNARQLAQLFQNLIDNGLKYNEKPRPAIEIAMLENQHEYLFSVKDNGIGIQPEHKDRIFKIFQRLHTDETYPGTGIGLAICKRIVENHEGKIWIDSTPGEGTTFYFTIHKNLGKTSITKDKMAALPI